MRQSTPTSWNKSITYDWNRKFYLRILGRVASRPLISTRPLFWALRMTSPDTIGPTIVNCGLSCSYWGAKTPWPPCVGPWVQYRQAVQPRLAHIVARKYVFSWPKAEKLRSAVANDASSNLVKRQTWSRSVSWTPDSFQVVSSPFCAPVPSHFPKWRGTCPLVPNGSGATENS